MHVKYSCADAEVEEFVRFRISLPFLQNQKGWKKTDNFLYMTGAGRWHSWQCVPNALIMLHYSPT